MAQRDVLSYSPDLEKVPDIAEPIVHQIDRSERQFKSFESGNLFCNGRLDQQHRLLIVQPFFEQKTAEWFLQRRSAITASKFGPACNQCDYQKEIDVFINKASSKAPEITDSFALEAMAHGVFYEDAAAYKFEQVTGKKIIDYGCLGHHSLWKMRPESIKPERWFQLLHAPEDEKPTLFTDEQWKQVLRLRWLKGSPDGVTDDLTVIEIKCPRSEFTNHVIKKGYLLQLLLNMEICGSNRGCFIQYRPQNHMFPEHYDATNILITDDWPDEAENEKPQVELIPKFLEHYFKKQTIIPEFQNKTRFINSLVYDNTVTIPKEWFEPFRAQAQLVWNKIVAFRKHQIMPPEYASKIDVTLDDENNNNIILIKRVKKRASSSTTTSTRKPKPTPDFIHMDEEWAIDPDIILDHKNKKPRHSLAIDF